MALVWCDRSIFVTPHALAPLAERDELTAFPCLSALHGDDQSLKHTLNPSANLLCLPRRRQATTTGKMQRAVATRTEFKSGIFCVCRVVVLAKHALTIVTFQLHQVFSPPLNHPARPIQNAASPSHSPKALTESHILSRAFGHQYGTYGSRPLQGPRRRIP